VGHVARTEEWKNAGRVAAGLTKEKDKLEDLNKDVKIQLLY
jgi:hypothetical protein